MKMLQSTILALFLLVCVLKLSQVKAQGQVANAGHCPAAKKKDPVGFWSSDTEFFHDVNNFGPNLNVWANIDSTCLPADPLNVYGAWYKLSIPGSEGVEIQTKVTAGPNLKAAAPVSLTTVSVFEGDCPDEGGTLTCLAFDNAGLQGGTASSETYFTLLTNTVYYVYVSVANVPGVNPPVVSIQPHGAQAQCEYFRSQQINFESYAGEQIVEEGLEIGICSECEAIAEAHGTTTWQTACWDACDQCYDMEGQFCFWEERHWSMKDTDREPTINRCFVYDGGDNMVCEQPQPTGRRQACPLVVNGVACTTCTNTGTCTGTADQAYGNFVADCTNVPDVEGVVDKCMGTGFEGTALAGYDNITDFFISNNDPNSPFIATYQGGCYDTNASTVPLSGGQQDLQEDRPAPLELPEAITLEFKVDTEREDIEQGEYKLYRVPVTGLTGIVTCEIDADNGDIDLFMSKNILPVANHYFDDCASEEDDSEEVCTVGVQNDTEVFAVVVGYAATDDFDIECELVDAEDARPFRVGVNRTSSEFDLEQNEVRLYKLEVPTGTQSVACTTVAQSGDLDLYMKAGEIPLPWVNVEKGGWDSDLSRSDGNQERAEIYYPDGDVYMLLQGYDAIVDGELACTVVLDASLQLTDEDANILDIGKRTKGEFDLLVDEQRLFEIPIPSGTSWVDCQVRSDNGDVDLYMRKDEVPVRDEGVDPLGNNWRGWCVSKTAEGRETCGFTLDGSELIVYAMVLGYGAVDDVRLECVGDPPLQEEDAKRIRVGDSVEIRYRDTDFARAPTSKLFDFRLPGGTKYIDCYSDSNTDLYFQMEPFNVDDVWFINESSAQYWGYDVGPAGSRDNDKFYIRAESRGGSDGSFRCTTHGDDGFEVSRRGGRGTPMGNMDLP